MKSRVGMQIAQNLIWFETVSISSCILITIFSPKAYVFSLTLTHISFFPKWTNSHSYIYVNDLLLKELYYKKTHGFKSNCVINLPYLFLAISWGGHSLYISRRTWDKKVHFGMLWNNDILIKCYKTYSHNEL